MGGRGVSQTDTVQQILQMLLVELHLKCRSV